VYHINGAMVTVSAPLYSGSSVVMPRRFSAQQYWQLVAKYRCTWSSIVPTIIKYLLDRADQEPFDFGNDERLAAFRFARSASAPLAAVTLGQWEQVFKVPMIETLGLTETAGTVSSNPLPPAPRKPGSVGLPYGNEIIIVDEQGRECPPQQVGELIIRGSNLLDYYYKNDEATAASIRDGWFYTGDLGKKDEDGYIFITGRSKELIIRGGENIAPREIDDVLYKHEAVLEAAAVGVDDENYGQEVVACVVLREGYQCGEDELKSFCESGVGSYKAPKIIYFMDDLPKGPSGKILRLQLPALIARLGADKS
jgi:long-chain acyl-CoA synthetase